MTKNTTNVDLTPNPFPDKKARDRIVQTINTFFKQWFAAKEKLNSSIVTVGDDNLMKEMTEEIEDEKSKKDDWWYEPFKGKPLGTRIDFGGLRFTDDPYVVKIPVEFHSKNNEVYREVMTEESEKRWVLLRYNEKSKQWVIHSFQDNMGFLESDYVFQGEDVVKSEFK